MTITLRKTQAFFSEEPRENHRQSQEFERSVQASLRETEDRVAFLETELEELKARIAAFHP